MTNFGLLATSPHRPPGPKTLGPAIFGSARTRSLYPGCARTRNFCPVRELLPRTSMHFHWVFHNSLLVRVSFFSPEVTFYSVELIRGSFSLVRAFLPRTSILSLVRALLVRALTCVLAWVKCLVRSCGLGRSVSFVLEASLPALRFLSTVLRLKLGL